MGGPPNNRARYQRTDLLTVTQSPAITTLLSDCSAIARTEPIAPSVRNVGSTLPSVLSRATITRVKGGAFTQKSPPIRTLPSAWRANAYSVAEKIVGSKFVSTLPAAVN